MEKRYQVFVSSTYADLKEERQRVTQTLMEMDCIPAGMELFPATDEEQWEFIKRVIDDCDYYLLIIGGRYGSTTEEGISYTEKEYDYAVENRIKVIALLHENPDSIPTSKTDLDPTLRTSLLAFREKISTNRLVKFWNDASELPGLVALSLTKTIKLFPATGWVRTSAISNEDLLNELNELRKENTSLKAEITTFKTRPVYNVEGLAGLDETFTVNGTYIDDFGKKKWSARMTWGEIFSTISPYLESMPNLETVKNILKSAIIKRDRLVERYNKLDDQDFQTILVQLKALGLIQTVYLETVKGGMAMFCQFTPTGEETMVQMRAIRSAQ